MNVYEIIKEKVLPQMEMFHNDLIVHDKREISENHGTPFIHLARKTGTWLVRLRRADEYPAKGERVPYIFGNSTREHILVSSTVHVLEGAKQAGMTELIQYYDGKKVREISFEKALEIAHEYVRKIRDEWEASERKYAKAS